MTHLSDTAYVAWFKREVARPGTFTALYPETTDDLVAGALLDGFWKARLDGWLPNVDADANGQTTPDVSMTAVALIITYAGIQFVRNELKNLPTRTTYRAPGGLEATTEHAATVLSEVLKELQQTRTDLLERALSGGQNGTPVFLRDGYAIRLLELYTPEMFRGFRVSPLELL